MIASPEILFHARTEPFERWFAAPGTALMNDKVNSAFLFLRFTFKALGSSTTAGTWPRPPSAPRANLGNRREQRGQGGGIG